MKTISIRIAALVGIIALVAATPAERTLAHTAAAKISVRVPAWAFCTQANQGSIEFTGDGHLARFTPPTLGCAQ